MRLRTWLIVAMLATIAQAGWFVPTCRAAHNVVVVLDDSGSMRERMRAARNQTKMDAAKQALITVLSDLPPDANVGIVTLNGRGDHWILPLGPVDVQNARQAVLELNANGGTPLGAYMKVGADALLESRAKEHYGIYRLLIVTDGEAGDPRLVESHLPDILTRGITVDVIGVDMQQNHSLATKVHTYRRADDPESLRQAVSAVFAESTVDPNDPGQSDFELLAPVPAEVAAASLAALAESGNHPIGEAPPPSIGTTGGTADSLPHVNTPVGGAPAGEDNGGGINWPGTLLAFAVILIVAVRWIFRQSR